MRKINKFPKRIISEEQALEFLTRSTVVCFDLKRGVYKHKKKYYTYVGSEFAVDYFSEMDWIDDFENL